MTTTIGQTALVIANLVIAAGADNDFQFRYLDPSSTPTVPVPINLTGWTGLSQIRDKVGGTVYGSFTVTCDASGYVTLSLAASVTTDPSWFAYTKGVWDLKLTEPGGEILPFAAGTVVISPSVTRTP